MEGVVTIVKNFYTIGEFARLLNVSEQTLRNWDESGKLVAHRTLGGGHRRYTPAQLAEFIDVDEDPNNIGGQDKPLAEFIGVDEYPNNIGGQDQQVVVYIKVDVDVDYYDYWEIFDIVCKLGDYLSSKYGDHYLVYDDLSSASGQKLTDLPGYQRLLDDLKNNKVKKLYLQVTNNNNYREYLAIQSVLGVKGVPVEVLGPEGIN